jgi:chemotaxis signal transduction protein
MMSLQVDPLRVLERIRQIEGELAEHWQSLASTPAESVKTGCSLRVLEIMVAGGFYLLPIEPVREVVAMAWPEPLPQSPAWVLGTVHYGTQPVPLIDLGLRLARQPTAVKPELLMVITDTPHWLGLVVSHAGQVQELDTGTLSSAGPEIPHAPFVLGMTRHDAGDPVHLLSVASLGRELERLQSRREG